MNTYAYTNAKPLMYGDPTGEAAFVMLANPAFWSALGSAASSVGEAIVGGVAAWAILSVPSDSEKGLTPAQQAQKDREHTAYKKICDTPPPPGLDKCAEAKWNLNRFRMCKQLRQEWDSKWSPGEHSTAINEMDNAIRNAERAVKLFCKDECP